MPNKLAVILIQGAGRGLGLSLTEHYLRHNRHVIATTRHSAGLQSLQKEFPQHLRVANLGLQHITPAAKKKWGHLLNGEEHINLLINCTNYVAWERYSDDIDDQALDDSLALNFIGPMKVARYFSPKFKEGTKIVNVVGPLSSITNVEKPGFFSYRTSKAAMNMFTRTYALELKKQGVVCVSAAPTIPRDLHAADLLLGKPDNNTQAGYDFPASAADAKNFAAFIDSLNQSDTGKFFAADVEKSEIEW
eukprot:TRINITY_DN1165_c0_g1_i1.p1 TRINITY_DN1165_c0_g1~~TRINITY_DN1165_c0_g1_i1.p1  ORF type:complete len:248 (+),score=54.91 TRINITY_DN1165_c0_g1_i1:84-827(+)